MLKFIDDFLNSITMYRLVLYYLILLVGVAFIFSIFHLLPFTPSSLIVSTTVLLTVCYGINKIFAKILRVQTNVESLYVTALILVLIITPGNYLFLVTAGIIAMASKYVMAINKKHIFNPAAVAVFITGITIHMYASWWIGTLVMFPFTLLGVFIIRKIRRFDLVFYFFITSLVSIFIFYFMRGNINVLQILKNTFFDSSILFFAFIMLSEPLTTPPTKMLQSVYGGIVGVLFSPIHFAGFYTTPETALLIGNVVSYIVSPKQKLILTLKEKIKLTNDIYDFVFSSSQKLNFKAGQYLEWTLGHPHTDSRGNRRYFTISSSPTENNIRIGVKFPQEKESSYKNGLENMKIGGQIIASQLAGDFTLGKDVKQKLVFIAGGIGVTPYRSIVKYLIDTNEKRDIVIIYSDKTKDMMVYKDIFDEAKKMFETKTIYYESEKSGHITSQFIKNEIPDFKERTFYLSGSHGMVVGFEAVLHELKLPKQQIKVDYFPGF